MEDAAAALASCLRDWFTRPGERSDIVLARVFQTTDWDVVPEDLRDYVLDRLPEGTPAPERCLALMGTVGDDPSWCDRHRSRHHQALPLSSPEALAASPMVSTLVERLGISMETFLHGDRHGAPEERDDFEVFFVREADTSPAVPDKQFVEANRVRSVIGFGGLLPGGEVFTVILFTREPVAENVAAMFRTVAVAAKLALLRAREMPLFRGQEPRPADALAVANARIGALEQMLAVQQQSVIAQTERLELALEDAVRSRHQAEREAEVNEALRQITQLLSAELDLEPLVQKATDAATRVTHADFGGFFYNAVEPDRDQYMLYTLSRAGRSHFESVPEPRATELLGPTFYGREVIRTDDITLDSRYGDDAPYFGTGSAHLSIRSYLAVPVISRSGEVHGGLFFGHPEVGVFDERAEVVAIGIAAQLAIALENARLYHVERSTALALQRSLLLQDVTVPDGLEAAYEYLPGGAGNDVGGDWFDVISIAGGRTAFVIGDVMGRGVQAAAIMGQLRTAIRAYAVSDLPPGLLMNQLNRLVGEMQEDLIATCIYAVVDQTENTVTMASSGHLPSAFVDPDGVVSLLAEPLGPPLGVPGAVHLEHTVEFPAGSQMLLFTDGLVEHRRRSLDEGLHALQEALDRALHSVGASPEGVCKELIATLQDEDSQDDDVTLLMVANRGLDRQELASRDFPPQPREAAAARRFVESTLVGWGDRDAAELVVMAVNELFINAVAHANTPVTLRLFRLPRLLIAELEDLDGHRPRRLDAGPDDEHHRGLQIVESLCTRWGSRLTEGGKVVWAEFDLDATHSARPA